MLPRLLCLSLPLTLAAQVPSREEVVAAMLKAARFYRQHVSTEGGYHYYYTADLSYGRSEAAEGPTQIEVQREATPIVALAFLEAYRATGEREFLGFARDAAYALLRGQLCSGGWDYLIEFDPQKRAAWQYRWDGNCGEDKRGLTNLDDNVTQGALRVLMRVDRALNFSDPKIGEAVRYALDKLLAAQYPIGAWPQRFRRPPDFSRYPVKRASYPDDWPRIWPGPNYQDAYTFNDNAICDVIDMLLEAARIYRDHRYRAAAEKGGQFILLAQMPDPQPAWAQQYDAEMHPAWARVFEPPAVTGGESQGVLRMLLTLYRETGDRRYLEPVPRALDYFKRSEVPRGPQAVFRRIPEGPILARFYELKTNRPLYITKGTRLQAAGLGSRMVDGYQISYSPDSVITHYNVLVSGRELAFIEEDFRRLSAADPASVRRPDTLSGLSPFLERFSQKPAPPPGPDEVRRILSTMDERGAWVTRGVIGKPDRLVFVYSARNMILRIGRGRSDGSAAGQPESRSQIIPLHEDDTVEIFLGPQPPVERIIRSSDFARNLTRLAEYVRSLDVATSRTASPIK
ncbi:MAG: pectate lyase [Bryobacteraceae bacterium]